VVVGVCGCVCECAARGTERGPKCGGMGVGGEGGGAEGERERERERDTHTQTETERGDMIGIRFSGCNTTRQFVCENRMHTRV
jgi:hypothetical protein